MTVSESCAAPRALNPEQLLYRIAEATSGRTGDEFFRALMRGLAQALGVRLSFLTECVDQPATRVRTLALWDGDRFLNNVEYELVQTPCEQVISEGRIYFCAQGLGDIFPAERDIADSYLGVPILDTLRRQVIGHIALLNEGAMAVHAWPMRCWKSSRPVRARSWSGGGPPIRPIVISPPWRMPGGCRPWARWRRPWLMN